MAYQVQHFINGKHHAATGRKLPIFNPGSGETAGALNVADEALVDQAVQAAKQAFMEWRNTPPAARASVLFRFKMLLEQHLEELAELVTREHGKTLSEAKASLRRGIDVVDFTCGIANHLKTDFAADVSSGVDSYALRQPLGVCAGITPFNFPAMIALWMVPMAIACGNSFILKPSEKDPSCSLRMMELLSEAGLPKGVVNVLQGDKETVQALLIHPEVKAISFVGSTPVAEYVYRTAVENHKRVQAFGGAKNHALVMPDADLDQVAQALVTAAYDCAGQRCMAISAVIVVGDEVADQLVAKMRPLILALKVGIGSDANTQLGPLVTSQQLERVKAYVLLGKQSKAQLVIDGDKEVTVPQSGFFSAPYLFDHVTPDMRIYQEEIFGPVLCVLRVKNFNEGLTLINQHEYGNGVAIFTRDGACARTFADQVQAGMVGINLPVPVPVAYHSFGGWKRSIFSDIGMYGEEGIRFYTKLKTITARWQTRMEV